MSHSSSRLLKTLRSRVLLSTALMLGSIPAFAGALPTGGTVAAGSASITTGANSVTVNQGTPRAVINWQTFSIGSGNTVQVNNGTNGATLNRVTTNNPSTIAGTLTATGTLYLVNQNGVVVTGSGQVVTGGSFVASSHDTDNNQFMNGQAPQFNGGAGAPVDNQGSITSSNGDVLLVGKSVSNEGSITAAHGTVGLAAGDNVTLQPAGGGPRVVVHGGNGDVTNSGAISAMQAELNSAGGNVYALAGASSMISATGVGTVGGHVWLTGKQATVAAPVSAKNSDGTGGGISVNADQIALSAPLTTGNGGTVDGTGKQVAVSGTASVQNGVDVAAVGGNPEVDVAAGNYIGQVAISKNLTLNGAGSGQTTLTAPASPKSLFQTSHDNTPVIAVTGNAKVNIANLIVDAAGAGTGGSGIEGIGILDASANIQNVTITGVRDGAWNSFYTGDQDGVALYVINDDNKNRTDSFSNGRIQDFQKNGSVFDGTGLTVNVSNSYIIGHGPTGLIAQNGLQYSDGAGGQVTGNTFAGFDYSPGDTSATAMLLYDAGNNMKIDNNSIFGDPSEGSIGLYVYNDTLTNQNLEIKGNSFNTGGEAVILWSSSNAHIENNSITNQKIGGDFAGYGVGIDLLGGSANIDINHNTIENNDTGVFVESDAGKGINVHDSNIDNNGVGLRNDSAFAVNAQNNWWGSASGPAPSEVVNNDGGSVNTKNPKKQPVK